MVGRESRTRSRILVLALLAANTVSQIGNVISLIAIPWSVLKTTGSAAKVGLAGLFSFLPEVLADFIGGIVVDRFGHRRASVVADILSDVTVALIPLLHSCALCAGWPQFSTTRHTSQAGVQRESSAIGILVDRGAPVATIDRAIPLVGVGVGLLVVFSTAGTISIGAVHSVALIFAGWVLVGAGIRPRGSRRLGTAVAVGLYLLVGVVVAGIVALPQSSMTAADIVPATDRYSAFVLIAVLWPIAAARLTARRAER